MDAPQFLGAVPMPGVLVDRTDRILAVNRDATLLLGEGLVGRNFVTMLRQPVLVAAIEKCLRHETAETARYVVTSLPQEIEFKVTCRFVSGAGTDNKGAALIFFEDITHLEKAGQIRRDFVANVSHELRTPLTALMGFIETLRGPARSDEAARERFLGIMEGEAARMNRLVGDLLSLSRVEDEERVRPTGDVILADILKSTLHSLRPVADEAGVRFKTTFLEAPIRLTADEDQLRQVFTNLIENAIKYGGGGGQVILDLSHVPKDAGLRGPAARVSVIDEGAGIDPLHIPRLTERFYRADSHRSRQLGGTGLGLAIVKHIVNRHRGRLKIESKPGQGSVFTVILPCHPVTQSTG